ncbi:MAG: hypothetical protein DRI57_31060 [Deltaproteobacteria bacterium]|nr:MAG: hypothetical protein DRI57_31060 [Deltaproteobacteria bacterium]
MGIGTGRYFRPDARAAGTEIRKDCDAAKTRRDFAGDGKCMDRPGDRYGIHKSSRREFYDGRHLRRW